MIPLYDLKHNEIFSNHNSSKIYQQQLVNNSAYVVSDQSIK